MKNNINAFPSKRISHYISKPVNGAGYDGAAIAEPVFVEDGGMSLRDYFATKAMQGMLANGDILVDGTNNLHNGRIAKLAYQYADSMLVERENDKTT